VLIHAALLRVNKNGDAVLAAPVPVDLGHGKLAEQDRGSYLVALELERTAEAETEGPGRLRFRAGWYVYAGDAEKKLRQELRGHERKTRGKKIVFPLDYLAPLAKTIKTLPMGSYRSLGCALSEELAALGGSPVVFPEGPDSSGRSPARLFYFSSPPLEDRRFVDMLFRYRHAEALRPR
jgi:sugar fermentation stimulation protein A